MLCLVDTSGRAAFFLFKGNGRGVDAGEKEGRVGTGRSEGRGTAIRM